jgi:hypothetical protein
MKRFGMYKKMVMAIKRRGIKKARPECLSRILILSIPDLKTATKERGG